MQQPAQETQHYQEDEINLKQLFRSLADRKWFIFGFTSFVTLLAVAYALFIPPTYQASISFVSPSQSSVLQLNKIKLTSETIYHKFLSVVMSSDLQRKIFDKNDYLTKLNPNNKPIKNLDNFVNEFTKSVTLSTVSDKKNEKSSYEKPIEISLEGGNPNIISSFLNDLSNAANKEIINGLLSVIQQKIDIRLDEISKQKILLLSRAKQDRLSQITRIKEGDLQKLNEINDQIDRLRVKARKDRLNKIQVLSDAATIAYTLGIIGNNFKINGNNQKSNSTSTVAIGDNQELPQWYLFGSNALLKEIDVLTNRTNDDPYIPEIVGLQNTLKEIQSNQTLKTLQSRQDDSPFIAEINKLEIEAIKLQSFVLDPTGINAMQINQHSYPPESPIKPKKRLIVAVAFVAGFMLSIFLVFIMNAFKRPEDEKSIA